MVFFIVNIILYVPNLVDTIKTLSILILLDRIAYYCYVQ